MKLSDESGEQTYAKVHAKFEEWEDNRPPPRRRRFVPSRALVSEGVERAAYAAVGIGISLLLLLLSATAFYAAYTWAGIARNGALVGYTVVGFFLLVAGLGGAIATWNQVYRLPNQRPAAHH